MIEAESLEMSADITDKIMTKVNRHVVNGQIAKQAKQETICSVKAQSHATGKVLMITQDKEHKANDDGGGKELDHTYVPYSVFYKKR